MTIETQPSQTSSQASEEPIVIGDVRQWWACEKLLDCRSEVMLFVDTLIADLNKDTIKPSHNYIEDNDPYDKDMAQKYAKMLVVGLMPPSVDCVNQIRQSCTVADRPACDTDPPMSIKYSSTDHSDTDLYATMLHTWMTEACLVAAGAMSYDRAFHPVAYNLKIDLLQQVDSLLYPSADIYPLMDYKNSSVFRMGFVASVYNVDSSWINHLPLLTLRKSTICAMASMVEDSLSVMPEPMKSDIRSHEEMRTLFNRLEPNAHKSFVKFYRIEAPVIPRFNDTDYILSVVKDWWLEARDIYVFGLNPPMPFDEIARANNIMSARVKTIQGRDVDFSVADIAQWYFGNRHMPFMYWAMRGDSARMNGHPPSFLTTPIWMDADAYRGNEPMDTGTRRTQKWGL